MCECLVIVVQHEMQLRIFFSLSQLEMKFLLCAPFALGKIVGRLLCSK